MTFLRLASVTALAAAFVVFGVSPSLASTSAVDAVAGEGELSAAVSFQVEVVVEDGEVSAPEPLPAPTQAPTQAPTPAPVPEVSAPEAPLPVTPSLVPGPADPAPVSPAPTHVAPTKTPATSTSAPVNPAEDVGDEAASPKEAASRSGSRGAQDSVATGALGAPSATTFDAGKPVLDLAAEPAEADSTLCVGSTTVWLPAIIAAGALAVGVCMFFAVRKRH